MFFNNEVLYSQIVEQLQPLNLEKIILFGSYAYGKPNEDSDLDLCIIEKSFNNIWEEKKKIRAMLKNIKMPKDILVTNLKDYEFYRKEINSVYNDIDTKGRVLWQRSS
ncbi:MAG: nucleotidyltransferase domain-containing protein [Sulfuricurvum sp.]|jgi:predicted nucleotidyltransferase|uniref:nucleotidyltransferase domain-containing protein n=1 Tax=Sulfuricurvum sp. TaxID=2025608 RepID=UPI0025F39ACE|nr:nucleotidyltransferase domain-containing protein [Sulfuricurvum sp.]MCK9373344.1 nucleotidyltransferase domain-containing protein [Sulfuricurvum sp.]